jgi:hypothetical protein
MEKVGESRQQFERFPGQMVQRACAGRTEGDLSGIGFGVVHEILQSTGRHGRMDDDGEGRNRYVRNRVQILDRIILRPILQECLGDILLGAAQENGVAVRAGVRDRGAT